jgi:hypothetical protein
VFASFLAVVPVRTEGTDALLAAAREAGVRRFVAQSHANLCTRRPPRHRTTISARNASHVDRQWSGA